MNRKDFRPSDRESTTKKSYNPVKPKKDVVKAFIRGENAHTGNDSLTSDGKTLYSYNTAIAVRQSDGNVIVNNTKYSPTTSEQQSILMQELGSSGTKYDVTGGKDRGYQGEDFSSEEKQLKADIKDEKQASKHYKEMSNDEKEHTKILEKQLKNDKKSNKEKIKEFNKASSDIKNDKNAKFTQEEKESLKRFANRKDKPQGRITLSEIKSENSARGQYFFSPSTMRMYRQVNAKYRVKYDKKTDTNYVIVNMKKYPESNERKEVIYKYNKENGHLDIE